MAELDPFGVPAGGPAALGNAVAGEEDPAAAFLAQQESEIAGIRLEALDANSQKPKAERKEKAKKELDEWYTRQDEQFQKTKADNRAAAEAFAIEESSPGTEWERVARLCDFNPKSSKQAKDVSRMRSVLNSLKQAPRVH
ncbi:hypothetical protein G4228_013783 [Cervus hanglu yarkandensis]|nr:hypothetical protein G4228_013783 [Cervus hanglu yarkandensis]